MDCYDCIRRPTFFCSCKDVYICGAHLSEHLIQPENHNRNYPNFKGTDIENYNFEKTKKLQINKELKSRIESLVIYRKNLLKLTKDFIKDIQKVTTKINSLLTRYQDLLLMTDLNALSKEDAENLLRSNMVLNPMRYKIEYEFRYHFLKEKFKIDHPKKFKIFIDSSALQVMKNKNFLNTHNPGFKCLSISSKGEMLVTGSDDGSVRFWDIPEKMQVKCFAQHKDEVSCITYSTNDSLVVSGSWDKTLVSWNIKENYSKIVYTGHKGRIIAVGISKNNDFITSLSIQQEIIIWKTGIKIPFKFITVTDKVKCGVMSSHNEFYAVADQSIEIFDLNKGISKLINTEPSITRCAALGKKQIFLSSLNSIQIRALPNGDLQKTLSVHKSTITSLSSTSDDQFLISGSGDNKIIIWDIKNYTNIHQYDFHTSSVTGIVVFKDKIFSSSLDKTIGISHISSKSHEFSLTLQKFNMNSNFFRNDLCSYGSNNQIIIYDIYNKEFINLNGHDDPVNKTFIFYNMKMILSSSNGTQHNFILWDLSNHQIISYLEGHKKKILCFDVSINEKFAISGDIFGVVILWDLVQKQVKKVLTGHTEEVFSVKFTQDAKFAASCGYDKKIIIWAIDNVCLYSLFVGNDRAFNRILVTPDDKYFVFIDRFSQLRVWSISEKEEKFKFETLEESSEWICVNIELMDEVSRHIN